MLLRDLKEESMLSVLSQELGDAAAVPMRGGDADPNISHFVCSSGE